MGNVITGIITNDELVIKLSDYVGPDKAKFLGSSQWDQAYDGNKRKWKLNGHALQSHRDPFTRSQKCHILGDTT